MTEPTHGQNLKTAMLLVTIHCFDYQETIALRKACAEYRMQKQRAASPQS
jgi:hypothetical protein